MNSTLQDLNRLQELVRTHINNPDELSKLMIELVSLFATIGEESAQSEALYAAAVVKELAPNTEGKKISVAESERLADLSTACERERLKNLREAVQELINAIKVRIRVLGVEEKQAGGVM